MEAYLDNSATTRVAKEVTEIVIQVMEKDFGNPSSKHMKGVESERYIKAAARIIAGILKADEKEIVFTSGGTESNNLALIGCAMANRRAGNHIITTAIEHPSVSEPLKYLESEGFRLTCLPVDGDGRISLEELKESITPDTIMVSTIFVNNETGAVQDVAAIGGLISRINPAVIYHVDAVQAFGKYEIYPSKMNIDLLSVSAHKFHGPKGAGFLYINNKVKIRPLMLGGGQQRGRRSGTDNVPGAAGLGKAAELAYARLAKNTARMRELKEYLTSQLEAINDELKPICPIFNIKINSRTEGAPHIVSASFSPIKSEVLLNALAEKGIYASAGSACSLSKPKLSGTLRAIGLSAEEADCTLRFSLCKDTCREEIDYTLSALKELLPVLSSFVAR
ncbi:MAG: cysteine desulfurase family protein [Lachnospiraceae bacterium]|jgi:cysteine desulfurase